MKEVYIGTTGLCRQPVIGQNVEYESGSGKTEPQRFFFLLTIIFSVEIISLCSRFSFINLCIYSFIYLSLVTKLSWKESSQESWNKPRKYQKSVVILVLNLWMTVKHAHIHGCLGFSSLLTSNSMLLLETRNGHFCVRELKSHSDLQWCECYREKGSKILYFFLY